MDLLVIRLELGSSGMRGSLDPSPSLVGDNDLLTEREELNLEASKWRGRVDKDPDVFRLYRGLGCGIDRSSPPMLRLGQFREYEESGLEPASIPPC
jgi:hypothetical protein